MIERFLFFVILMKEVFPLLSGQCKERSNPGFLNLCHSCAYRNLAFLWYFFVMSETSLSFCHAEARSICWWLLKNRADSSLVRMTETVEP